MSRLACVTIYYNHKHPQRGAPHLRTGITLVIDASVDRHHRKICSRSIASKESQEACQVRLACELFQVSCDAEHVRRCGLRRVCQRIIQHSQACRRYYRRAVGRDRITGGKCCRHFLQLEVTIGKSRGVKHQFRRLSEGTWRTEVCCWCDCLHVLVQDSGQRIANRADDGLVRLCVAKDLV